MEKMSFPAREAVFCAKCGSRLVHALPPGETRTRAVCPKCGYIHYVNPLPVSGTLPVWKEKILLCRRAIEPRKGFWTLPGGYVESGEATSEGALRETWEEAGFRPELRKLYAVMDVPFGDQMHFFYLADMRSEHSVPGPESAECRLFAEDEIPWNSLAFPTVTYLLKQYFLDRRAGTFPTHHTVLRPECLAAP